MTQRRDTSAGEIQARYRELYGSGQMSITRNCADKFPLLEHILKPHVTGKDVLDFGCGPGRLTLTLGRWANRAVGMDFAESGIATAWELASIANADNVEFTVGGLQDLPQEEFDVVVSAGTFEHFENPEEGIAAFKSAVRPGGLLLIQSPAFANFRGDVYGTLLYLQDLPMSLTDLWQVTRTKMNRLAADADMQIERVVGGHYNFGFTERVPEDLRHRVPAAARDAGVGEEWSFDAFFDWLDERASDNRLLIDSFVEHGFLKPVPPSEPLSLTRPPDIDDEIWTGIERYLTYDGSREPYWSDSPPYCYLGASVAYFLRKSS